MGTIFDYPEIPMSIVSGLVFALVTAGGIVFGKRFIHRRVHGDESANNVVEMTIAVFSAFYGILLGLLAVGAYENIEAIEDIITKEAAAIVVLYRNFNGFPQPTRDRLQNDLQAYAREVVGNSFQQQAAGVRPQGEGPMVDDMFNTVTGFVPQAKREETLQAESLRQLSDLEDARQARLSDFDAGIPPVLWWIVGLGAAITLLLICILDYPLRPHLAFGCLLGFFIGAMIFVVASMDNPSAGYDRVGPEAIEELLSGRLSK